MFWKKSSELRMVVIDNLQDSPKAHNHFFEKRLHSLNHSHIRGKMVWEQNWVETWQHRQQTDPKLVSDTAVQNLTGHRISDIHRSQGMASPELAPQAWLVTHLRPWAQQGGNRHQQSLRQGHSPLTMWRQSEIRINGHHAEEQQEKGSGASYVFRTQ